MYISGVFCLLLKIHNSLFPSYSPFCNYAFTSYYSMAITHCVLLAALGGPGGSTMVPTFNLAIRPYYRQQKYIYYSKWKVL